MTKLDHLYEAVRDLIDRAQKTEQDDDWQQIDGQWDLNAWIPEGDSNWRVTAYPVIDGETDTERGIMLRGSGDGPRFPTLNEIEESLRDEELALTIGEQWDIEVVDGPAIKVTPHDQGEWIKNPPSLVWPYDPTAGG
jgi:hypothetical protein